MATAKKNSPPPVVVPPTTYTLELTEFEMAFLTGLNGVFDSKSALDKARQCYGTPGKILKEKTDKCEMEPLNTIYSLFTTMKKALES